MSQNKNVYALAILASISTGCVSDYSFSPVNGLQEKDGKQSVVTSPSPGATDVPFGTSPSGTPSPSPSPSVSALPSVIPSPRPSSTATAAPTPSVTPSQTATPKPTPSATASPTPTLPPSSGNPSPTPSASPTEVVVVPTPTPTVCTRSCAVPNGMGTQSCSDNSTCTVTMCNPGYIVQNGACVLPTVSTTFTCTSYEQLHLNESNQLVTSNGASIPARDPNGSGICYYYPIVNLAAPLTGSSYLNGNALSNHDQDVVSRNHDINARDPKVVWHPYIMNKTKVDVTFAGFRTLNLTGGSVGTSGSFATRPIAIDNFFLIGAHPKDVALTTGNLNSYFSAWGTGDATVAEPNAGTDTHGVAFYPKGLKLATDQTKTYSASQGGGTVPYSTSGVTTASPFSIIPLNVQAPGGTASVPQVSLTNYITPNVPTTIDFRALDCGGARYLGNIFLLIQ